MSSYFSPKRDALARLNSQNSRVHGGVNNPMGYYPRKSKTPPQKLPHLSTPPPSPGVLDLRRSYYGVVPPVNHHKPTWKRRYLSRQEAAVIIQRHFRGWTVRKGPRFRPWRYMCHKRFGGDFVKRLIEEFLIEDIFPELLQEVLGGKRNASVHLNYDSAVHALDVPVKRICEDIISEGVQLLARQVANEVFHGDISFKSRMTFNYTVLSRLSEDIMEEFIREERIKIVHETISDLVSDHMIATRAADWLDPFIDEAIEPLLYDVASKCLKDAQFMHPYEEILEYEMREIATDVYEEFKELKVEEEYREVLESAQDRVVDGLCLEHLLTHIIGNNHKIYYDDYMDKLLDGFIVDILLGVYFTVNKSVESTVKNWPLDKLHQDVTSDIAVDVVLEELTAQLDEDMLDAHEHEQNLKS